MPKITSNSIQDLSMSFNSMTTTGGRIYIGYVRVSSKAQNKVNHLSIQTQTDIITKDASLKSYDIDKFVSDVGTGRHKRGQPNLWKLVKTNKNCTIIVSKMDRLCRNVSNYLELEELLTKNNINIYSVNDGIDTSISNNAIKQHLIRTLISDAQKESDILSERINACINYRKTYGLHWGRVPFGFVLNKETSKLVSVEYEQNVIKFMIGLNSKDCKSNDINILLEKISPLYGTTDKWEKLCFFDVDETPIDTLSDGLSFSDIADILNSYNVKKRGRDWTYSMIKNVIQKHSQLVIENDKMEESIPEQSQPVIEDDKMEESTPEHIDNDTIDEKDADTFKNVRFEI